MKFVTQEITRTPGLQNFAHEQMGELEAELTRSVHMPETDYQIAVAAVALEGALLFEGAPSTGKTRSATTIAAAVGGKLGRVQGTPDVMPSDITGTRIWNPKTAQFDFAEGPVFSNVFFVDEANRMPTKSQSAMLEAMQERQVTIPGETESRQLPKPFVVLAAQNPTEHAQGTNPLTVAQLDRFNVSINLPHPNDEDYLAIYSVKDHEPSQVVDVADIPQMKQAIEQMAVAHDVKSRAIKIVTGLRMLDKMVDANGSALSGFRAVDQTVRYGQALALQQGERVVGEEHIDTAAQYTLRHRVAPTYDAIDQGVSAEDTINEAISNLK